MTVGAERENGRSEQSLLPSPAWPIPAFQWSERRCFQKAPGMLHPSCCSVPMITHVSRPHSLQTHLSLNQATTEKFYSLFPPSRKPGFTSCSLWPERRETGLCHTRSAPFIGPSETQATRGTKNAEVGTTCQSSKEDMPGGHVLCQR